ncbi:MAG: chromosome segregation protein SMC [Bacteroidota bacterium]|nr:chromosome segregation protein SMC [Bacteroidota bacterium]
MYISELELQGFKSFAHATKVSFDSGITSIVGPNGCGKSNIVDALRWVLGEQRPSLLRSSAMSNVIFNGTAKKKALGMAEVSLTFVNDKGILPIEYSELTITRRLYRSGDSEYLINGTTCRLKDIMELFMDTGMGSDAYSVIELKMVEEILNDKINDRRKLFEEAAGVTRYKDQRKRSLRKLEETRKDLQRIDDLLIELRKKTRSLEIQAEKAIKAKGYKKELEKLDKAITLYDYERIQQELNPLIERINSAGLEKNELQQKLNSLETNDEQARKALLEKERAQAEAQRRVQSLVGAVQEATTQIRIAQQKIESEEKVLSEYKRDIEQGNKDLAELQKVRTHSQEKLEEFATEQARSEKSLEDSRVIYSQTQQQYSKVRHEIYELEVQISAAKNELSKLQARRIKIESKLENTEGNLERIEAEIYNLNNEIATIAKHQSQVDEQLETKLSQRNQQEKLLEEARVKKEQFAHTQNETRDQIRNLKSDLASAESECHLLKDLVTSNEAYPSSVQYLLEEQRFNFKNMTTVSDIFSTDETYAIALESALGPILNYLVVDTMDEVLAATKLLKDHKKGLATFIPLQLLAATYDVADGSLFHHVNSKKKYSALKQLLLGNILVFEDAELMNKSKLKKEWSSVSLQGDVRNQYSFYTSGSKSTHAGIRVSLNTKIERLEKKQVEIQKELHKLTEYLEQIQSKSSHIDFPSLSKVLKDLEQQIRTLEQQKHSMSSKVQVYQKNITNQVKGKNSLQSNEGNAQQELANIAPSQKEIEQKLDRFNHKLEQQKSLLESLEEQRSGAQSRYNDAQLKHQDITNKIENHEREIQRAQISINEVEQRIKRREERINKANEHINFNTEQVTSSKDKLAQSNTQKEKADQVLSETQEAAAIERGSINEIEKELKEIRRQKEVNIELVHHLHMAKEKMDLQSERLRDHVWESYGLLIKQLQTEPLSEKESPEEVKERISWLKHKVTSLGEVNPLAIEEYEEENKRLNFYKEQIEDLTKAEIQLLETIDEINTTATERFNQTFEKVRKNFQLVFKTLFSADDLCDLIIEQNAEDPLEARIEIKAQPRGKRPSGISQLSGGEKTLTAIALLFAIYLVKPSPFCVLDEVDAPLDDANIERFAKMIKEFSNETQFIIITHNKKTMSKAEMMYGVTMPENGVSRLVGVRMEDVA